jgi:hypothetical protein
MELNLHFSLSRHGGAFIQQQGPIFVALHLINQGETLPSYL